MSCVEFCFIICPYLSEGPLSDCISIPVHNVTLSLSLSLSLSLYLHCRPSGLSKSIEEPASQTTPGLEDLFVPEGDSEPEDRLSGTEVEDDDIVDPVPVSWITDTLQLDV